MEHLSIVDGTPSRRRMTALTNEIQHAYDTQSLINDPHKKERVAACLMSLQEVLLRAKVPLAAMMNYGSSLNGFGSNKSDIDVTIHVSFRFEAGDSEAQLRKVAEILRKCDGNSHAQFDNGRMPLVSAKYRGFEIDMCLDGEEAVVDAKLLRAYGNWEPRLFVVGLFVKKWAKAFGICSGSRGFFKSYHWIVLTINCFQKVGRRTKKGRNIDRLLPYIQTEFWTDEPRKRPWRYFETNVIPNWSTNTSSVGELFLYFLDFYKDFNFKHETIHVVSRARVARRKTEYQDAVCIRDPFYRGRKAHSQLSYVDRLYYDEHYGGPLKQNSAKKVTPENLKIIQDTMRMTADQIRAYIHEGKPMASPVLVSYRRIYPYFEFRINCSTYRVNGIFSGVSVEYSLIVICDTNKLSAV